MGITGTDAAPLAAIAGLGRAGAMRANGVSAQGFVFVAGVDVSVHVEQGSLAVDEELDEVPNTCQFRLETVVPSRGDEVIVTLGTTNRYGRLFAGHALRPKTQYIDRGVVGSQVSATDYTALLKGIIVTKHYVGWTATAIFLDLASEVPGFSTQRVATDLPVIDEITITNQSLDKAFSQVMARIGGYWDADYRHGLIASLDDQPDATVPIPLAIDHPTLEAFEYDPDDSQALNRCYVEGRGTTILGAVGVGETTVPLLAVDMFEASGEFGKVSFQGSSGAAQHLTFTGVVPGGGGAFVGPGVTPSTPPSTITSGGTGVDVGAHGYAFTWVTAAGETRPSPIGSVTTGVVPAPASAPSHYSELSGWTSRYAVGDTLQYAISYSYDFTPGVSGDTALVAGASYTVPNWTGGGTHGAVQHVTFTIPAGLDPLAKYFHIWCNQNGGGYKLLISNPASPQAVDITDAFGFLGAAPPAANATVEQVSVSSIAVGPTGVTSRKLYRTAAGGSQLKLLHTFADNTTTSFTDSTADASLGANAPTSDTSGLTQPTGQVNAGDTSIITSGGAFSAGGGWAIIGNGQQAVRYTGITGNTLTGIPATGPGSIQAPITYNSSITACPLLTGIPASGPGSILEPLSPGDQIFLVVQVDNLGAQATLAARYTTADYTDDGIRATWVQDRRLSIAEARARGAAEIAQVFDGIKAASYTVKDQRSKTGRLITIDGVAGISDTLKIQRVSISGIATAVDDDGFVSPTYAVEASNQRYSLEDVIRQNRGLN